MRPARVFLEKFRKNLVGASRHQKIYQGNKRTRCFIMLLPLQGAGRNAMIPRAMPWATIFCPFRAWGANRKGAAEIYMLLLPYSFVSSHHRKVSKYTLHLERLQFFFCQSSYLLDLRPRHTYCQQVTGYFQTFR